MAGRMVYCLHSVPVMRGAASSSGGRPFGASRFSAPAGDLDETVVVAPGGQVVTDSGLGMAVAPVIVGIGFAVARTELIDRRLMRTAGAPSLGAGRVRFCPYRSTAFIASQSTVFPEHGCNEFTEGLACGGTNRGREAAGDASNPGKGEVSGYPHLTQVRPMIRRSQKMADWYSRRSMTATPM